MKPTLVALLALGLCVVGCGKKTRNVIDCVDCGGIVAPSAASCPHCGSTDFTGSKAKAAAEAKEHKGYRANRTDKIEFDNESFKIEADATNKSVHYVTGLVRNTSSEPFEQVELKFSLYDAQGTKLGETIDYTHELGPNTEWRFRAAFAVTNVVRGELVEIVVR